jgi:hypothetical protein
MHGQQEGQMIVALYSGQGEDGMPVMAVHYIEVAEELLHRTETMIEGIAHPVHLIDDIAMVIYISPLVVHPIYLVIGLKVPSTGKNMDLMAPPGQRFR